jgi:hypothetical protein
MITPREPVGVAPEAIAAAILEAVSVRGAGKSLCPSEVARGLDRDNWRTLMPAVRAAALRLAQEGRIQITQRGRAVVATSLRGAVRLRLP